MLYSMKWHPMSISSKRSGKAIEIWAIHRPREVCREGQGFPGPENTRQIKLGKLGTAPFFGLVREERRRLQEDWHFFFSISCSLTKSQNRSDCHGTPSFFPFGPWLLPSSAATRRNTPQRARTKMFVQVDQDQDGRVAWCQYGKNLEEFLYIWKIFGRT